MTQTTGTSTIDIAADPTSVWAILTDFNQLGALSPEAFHAEWEPGTGKAGPGARFTGYNRQGDFEWETSCLVIGSVPGIEWSFAVTTPDGPATIWRYLIDITDNGCRVTETFDSPALTGDYFQTMDPPRHQQLSENISLTLRNLRTIAEQA